MNSTPDRTVTDSEYLLGIPQKFGRPTTWFVYGEIETLEAAASRYRSAGVTVVIEKHELIDGEWIVMEGSDVK